MAEPLVTVGIPFLNNGRTLLDAIRSVFAQSYTNWRLILADDGSTDESVRIARSVADPRVTVVTGGTPRGFGHRLNEITSLATGEYLARMDGDDLMHPDRLRRQMAYLLEHPEVDAIDCGIYSVDYDLKPQGKRGVKPLQADLPTVLRNGMFIHPTVIGRTEWFRRNPFNADYVRGEDQELWCRTCQHSRFGRVTDPLLFYRESYNVSLKNYLRGSRAERRILREYGPRELGTARTLALVGRAYLKSAAYLALGAVRRHSVLVRRRNLPLGPEEARAAEAVVATVKATPVPGV